MLVTQAFRDYIPGMTPEWSYLHNAQGVLAGHRIASFVLGMTPFRFFASVLVFEEEGDERFDEAGSDT